MLLEWLDGTRDETEMEHIQADEELAANARESEAMYHDGKEGKLDLLSSLGIRTVAEYQTMFKADPPPDLARILADL